MENSKRKNVSMQEKPRLSKAQGASTPDENLGELHWTFVKNMLKYLWNTKGMFLVYGGDIKRELKVTCYNDVGYLTDADDSKSHTGYVFVFNGGAILATHRRLKSPSHPAATPRQLHRHHPHPVTIIFNITPPPRHHLHPTTISPRHQHHPIIPPHHRHHLHLNTLVTTTPPPPSSSPLLPPPCHHHPAVIINIKPWQPTTTTPLPSLPLLQPPIETPPSSPPSTSPPHHHLLLVTITISSPNLPTPPPRCHHHRAPPLGVDVRFEEWSFFIALCSDYYDVTPSDMHSVQAPSGGVTLLIEKSAKQSIIETSSTEVEYMVASEVFKEVV
ncbi:hypothetical protein Tco_1028993 [Tanacetum coccineum]|uniref:Uncharacterized protein n=1 Tax=Tanacetum coccineum TaxID=301880 RepID=A0ABQ5G271_9ASTR